MVCVEFQVSQDFIVKTPTLRKTVGLYHVGKMDLFKKSSCSSVCNCMATIFPRFLQLLNYCLLLHFGVAAKYGGLLLLLNCFLLVWFVFCF